MYPTCDGAAALLRLCWSASGQRRAVMSVVHVLRRWVISNKGFPADQIASGPLQFFIFAVTIVVVAVPEGLPLAVTISLVSLGVLLADSMTR